MYASMLWCYYCHCHYCRRRLTTTSPKCSLHLGSVSRPAPFSQKPVHPQDPRSQNVDLFHFQDLFTPKICSWPKARRMSRLKNLLPHKKTGTQKVDLRANCNLKPKTKYIIVVNNVAMFLKKRFQTELSSSVRVFSFSSQPSSFKL